MNSISKFKPTDAERQAAIFQDFIPAADIADQAYEQWASGVNNNAFLPFWDRDGERFALRPGELTIWFGARGSMKSTVINQLALDHAIHKAPTALLSYEMDMNYLYGLMVGQCAMSDNFTKPYMDKVTAKIRDRLWLTPLMNDTPKSSIGKVQEAINNGAKLVILDCLQRIHMPDNDLNTERQFVVYLSTLCREAGAHLVLVHHTRKMGHSDGDNPRPTIDDLKGSGGLADNSHNVVAVWADKKLKSIKQAHARGVTLDGNDMARLNDPDVMLLVKKQRMSAFESGIKLWLHEGRHFSPQSKPGRPWI